MPKVNLLQSLFSSSNSIVLFFEGYTKANRNPYANRYTYRSIPLEKSYHTIENEQYEFINKLGQGGFGAVYSAKRLRDGEKHIFS